MSYSGAATARAARENLGRSLAALQEDPNIPPDVLAVAQNLAQAVGKLFEAERATSEPEGKGAIKTSMGLIGQTLALLQDVRGQHRGIQQATETLAASMSQLYPLTTAPSLRPGPSPVNAPMVGAPAPVAPAMAPQYAQQGQQPQHPQQAPQPTQALHPQHPQHPQQGYGQPTQAYAPPQPAAFSQPSPSAFQQPAQAPFQQASPSAFQQPAQPAAFAQPSPSAFQQPQIQQAPAPQVSFQQPGLAFQRTAPSQVAVQAPPAAFNAPQGANARPQQGTPEPVGYRGNQNREKIEVNIGATTESNFFVGFSGEIAEGGVFAATYNIQPRGTPMLVHITLPGGFDKLVNGVVKFVRDPMDMAAEDTVPGMGVQFEGIDPEGRELILRFIRKRPPMFYDE